jgi:hypothetical protein
MKEWALDERARWEGAPLGSGTSREGAFEGKASTERVFKTGASEEGASEGGVPEKGGLKEGAFKGIRGRSV